jgi:hypothetical protein
VTRANGHSPDGGVALADGQSSVGRRHIAVRGTQYEPVAQAHARWDVSHCAGVTFGSSFGHGSVGATHIAFTARQ